MEAMELFNILKKVGIAADETRFTSETFEYSSPFYKFEEYINENHIDFDFHIDCGATKTVLVPEKEDYVIKIPFTGTEDWDNQPNWINEETGELEFAEDYDAYVPFQKIENYCEQEVINYQKSVIEGVSEAFAEINYLGNAHGFPIYVQKKVTVFWEEIHRTKHTKEEINTLSNHFKNENLGRLSPDWCLDFIAVFGEQIFKNFIHFIEKYHINDLHDSNVAYKNGKPILCDYSGFWE